MRHHLMISCFIRGEGAGVCGERGGVHGKGACMVRGHAWQRGAMHGERGVHGKRWDVCGEEGACMAGHYYPIIR